MGVTSLFRAGGVLILQTSALHQLEKKVQINKSDESIGPLSNSGATTTRKDALARASACSCFDFMSDDFDAQSLEVFRLGF